MMSKAQKAPAPGEFWLFLALGNLSSFANWLLGVPVNVGGTGILLAAFIFWYVWRKKRIRQAQKQQLTASQQFRFGWDKLLIAFGAGVAITLPPMLFFLFPVVVGNLGYNPIKTISLSELLYRTLLSVPLFTAIPEELLFRSYFYHEHAKNNHLRAEESKPLSLKNTWSEKLKQGFSNLNRQSLVFNVVIFTLWHLVVVARTVLDTNLSDNIFLGLLSYVGALAAVAVGAVVFWLVRWKTGSFWYSALTHWLNVALMNWVIWLS